MHSNDSNHQRQNETHVVSENRHMKGTPIVSISCVTYNHKDFIAQAIEGFLMQRCSFPFEILIHDDASTDGTADIIRKYEHLYPDLIKPIYQTENQFSLRKQNISQLQRKRALGKYIAICEGDDYWTDPLKLQKQVEFLESHPDFSMCFHACKIENQTEDTWKDQTFAHLTEKEYTGTEILSQWTVPTASVMYRIAFSERLDTMPRPQGLLYFDIMVYLTLAECGRIYCLGDAMCVYRIHPNSRVHKKDDQRPLKYITHLKTIQTMFGGKYRNVPNREIADRYLTLVIMSLQEKKVTTAFSYLFQACKYDVLSPVKRLRSFLQNQRYKSQKGKENS